MAVDLGDYVHARHRNYLQYGLSQQGLRLGRNAGWTASLAQQKNKIEQYIINKGRAEGAELLQTKLNNLVANTNFNSPDLDEIGNKVSEALYDSINTGLKSINLNSFTVNHAVMAQEYEKLAAEINKIRNTNKTDETHYRNLASLKKRIEKFADLVEELKTAMKSLNQGSVKYSKLEQMSNTINNEKKALESLLSQLTLNAGGNRIIQDEKFDTFVKEYNRVVNIIATPDAKIIGQLGEYGDVGLILMMDETVADTVEDIKQQLKTSVVGNQKNKAILNRGNMLNMSIIGDMINTDSKGRKAKRHIAIKDENNIIGYELNGGSQTVDISVQLDPNGVLSNHLGTDILNASIKNYNLFNPNMSTVHILSEAPLTSILILCETAFANHYLNLVAASTKAPGSSLEDSYDTGLFEAIYRQYDEMIKRTAMVRALTGETGNGTGPRSDYFIIRNNGAGRQNEPFRVYSTQSLFNRISISQDLETEGFPLSNSITQTWIGKESSRSSAIDRISHLVGSLHAQKIKLSIKKEFFL